MDSKTKKPYVALHKACTSGDIKTVEEILKTEESANFINSRSGHDKKAALHIACDNNKVSIIKLLLSHPQLNVDLLDGRKWTPLQIAANHGFCLIVELLLEHKADPLYCTENGNLACHNASMHGHAEVVKMLLSATKDSIDKHNVYGWTCLHLACVSGHTRTVKVLLDNGANTEILTCLHETASNIASKTDSVEILRLLKEKKADFNMANIDKEAPIHAASMTGQSEVVEFLIKSGVDVTSTTKDGLNGIHLAAKNGHGETLHVYHDNVVNFQHLVNAKSASNNILWSATMGCGLHLPEVTPLHLAVLEAKVEATRALLECGADKDALDGHGRTPLGLLQAFLNKFQTWDKEAVGDVKDLLEGTTHEDDAIYGQWNSDYQSTCTSENIADSVHELEHFITNISSCNSKQADKGIERVRKEKKELDKIIQASKRISGDDKKKYHDRLRSMEEMLTTILGVIMVERKIHHGNEMGNDDPKASQAAEIERRERVKKFRANFTALQEQLVAEDHMHYLFQENVLEPTDIEQIYKATSSESKVAIMMHLLYTKKDTKWIDVFVDSLCRQESCKHLAGIFRCGGDH